MGVVNATTFTKYAKIALYGSTVYQYAKIALYGSTMCI